ncbi:hypothetical protein Pmani_014221 [Petrolisthes manimaculis]|uniref:UBZ4-type domain-containing protein n=1 Tax=Petrolisthes manimaculis TaxID=1843537 RepID=A0AAE1PUT1_9EUCA|nr:hypothetical protein Pmani_014221 [Petrolisthes manimaculis]
MALPLVIIAAAILPVPLTVSKHHLCQPLHLHPQLYHPHPYKTNHRSIAFSGTTPEHQNPVVQAHSRPTSLNTHTPSPRTSTTPTREAITINDDKRRYEAMGARPKVALRTGKRRGMVEEVVRGLEVAGADGTGKGLGSVEDESTAKHRARSILASAIPVSPVSSGHAPPFPTTLAKSPSAPVIAKVYVPITSTVLTPVNFRPPFVAHKRPSAIKQAALQAQQQSDSPVSTPNTHTINKTATATTAFASITITTTAAGVNAPPSSSSYSSTTSSRSSSPGMSLTTFGLNSEGRGIPGAIFFAMGSDQRNNGHSPQPTPVSRSASTSSVGVKSPTPDSVVNKDSRPPSGIKSPPVSINSSSNGNVGTVKQEHWWSVEWSGGEKQSGGKLVNSTWVRLMGGQASTKAGSGLPWRTVRSVSGQQLDQARRASHDDPPNGATTATFTCTPAVNSPASSTLSSAASSGASSPLPCSTSVPNHELKSLASKNISSAIMSYELGSKCEVSNTTMGSDGVATLTRRDLVCPSCQMLFPPDKHVNLLDHFEVCRGPEYADL